ncbi:branched-chain amino acid ABC transporter permease [Microbaculum marinum]|uniref:Branched-chain amino acid ABC transporter permease n=1 Tax=Microbaculum marinum TaxID=1764581 RepID=A0AAW9RE06_9HYPH
MNFLLSYVILAEIFAIMSISTNLLVGIIGIFSVSQAALMGIGAYTYALCAMAGIDFVTATAIAVLICSAFSILTSLPSLRLAGDYFVVTSFGIQLVATAVFINWSDVTGGASGIPAIPPPQQFGFTADLPTEFIYVSTILLAGVSLIYWLMIRSTYGRILHAIRIDETAVAAAGRNVLRAKLGTAALSGAFAALGGALFASFLSYADPTSFDIHVSVLILTMLVVGGARTLRGAILGPFVLLAIPQLLTLVELPSSLLGPARQFVYGVLLVLFMLLRPQGIAGKRI